MFRNLKVGPRVIAGFVSVALCTAAVAVYVVDGMKTQQDNLAQLFQETLAPLNDFRVVSDAYAVNVVDNTHKMRAGTVSLEDGKAQMLAARVRIDSAWKAYRSSPLDDEEKRLASEAEAVMAKRRVLAKQASVLPSWQTK